MQIYGDKWLKSHVILIFFQNSATKIDPVLFENWLFKFLISRFYLIYSGSISKLLFSFRLVSWFWITLQRQAEPHFFHGYFGKIAILHKSER